MKFPKIANQERRKLIQVDRDRKTQKLSTLLSIQCIFCFTLVLQIFCNNKMFTKELTKYSNGKIQILIVKLMKYFNSL